MSLFDRLLGRRPALSPDILGKLALAERIASLVAELVREGADRAEIRRRLAKAAEQGDLDFLIEGAKSDQKKAQDFIDNG